jgi:hypothetical protein
VRRIESSLDYDNSLTGKYLTISKSDPLATPYSSFPTFAAWPMYMIKRPTGTMTYPGLGAIDIKVKYGEKTFYMQMVSG